MFEDILYKYKSRTFLPEEFLEYYIQEVKNYNLDVGDRTEARFLVGFAERSFYTISTFGRKFRYYDLNIEEEYIESIKEIVEEYEDGSYSTLKLFNENPELMKSLDLTDEYELHNLIKKCDIHIESVRLERSPGFIKGDIDKKEFYKNELLSFSGDSIDNFTEYLYEEFGLKQETMKAYISNNFREYIDGDKIVLVYENSPEKINVLKPKLDKIFYSKVEITKLLKSHELDYSSYILSKLGYHIYKNLVYKKKYLNGYRAFLEYIKNKDEFRLDTIELHGQSEFMHFIYRAEMNRELVSINKGVYLTRGFLEESGLQREMIDTFVNNVYSFVASKKYFSYRQLLDEGFTDELIDHGFDDYFYERLLTSSDKFFAVTRNTPVIFIDEKEDNRDVASFIEHELLNNESGISIIDFKEYLMTKYHTEFEIDRLIGIIKRGTCFYSNKLEKVFHNSDDFLKKIYP
ncbi:hypothetical protein QP358_02840 [Nosocomiicoccus ampullae]|nr:hypothetical protein [Nosocomiicoccus ampullae]